LRQREHGGGPHPPPAGKDRDRPGGAPVLESRLGPGVQAGKGDADMKAVFVNGNMEQDIKQEIAQAVMGEGALPGPEPPRRLTERTAAKVTACLLLVVMAMTLCGGILAALVFYNADVYITPEDDFKRELLEGVAYNDAYNLISWAVPDGEGRDRQERAEDFCA